MSVVSFTAGVMIAGGVFLIGAAIYRLGQVRKEEMSEMPEADEELIEEALASEIVD